MDIDRRDLLKLVGASAVVTSIGSSSASAQGHTIQFSVDGPLENYNRAERTLTVFGLPFTVPQGTSIQTGNKSVTFSEFTDGTSETVRSVKGGLIDIIATATVDANGTVTSIEANTLLFRFADNSIEAVVTGVDQQANTVDALGVTMGLSDDPRAKGELLFNGEPVQPRDVNTDSEIAAHGYWEKGVYKIVSGTVSGIGTSLGNKILIRDATYDADKFRLDVVGSATTESNTATVDVEIVALVGSPGSYQEVLLDTVPATFDAEVGAYTYDVRREEEAIRGKTDPNQVTGVKVVLLTNGTKAVGAEADVTATRENIAE